MMKVIAVAGFLALADAASAQQIVVEKHAQGSAVLTRTDIEEIQQFKARLETEQQIILITCREYMFSKQDQARWSLAMFDRAVIRCVGYGEREYVLNYRFHSPYLATALQGGAQ